MSTPYICKTGRPPFEMYLANFKINNSGKPEGDLVDNINSATKFSQSGMAAILSGKGLEFVEVEV